MRADIAALSVKPETGVANFLPTGDSTRRPLHAGGRPRIPLSVHQRAVWGTQTIEPIAQLIVRPNETQIGKLPNEDAQSLIFDDSNLFSVNKFSGWDRIEGGTRLNAGMQYTAQFNRGGFVNVLFGQSYQLFGQNSFAVPDTVNTGLSSGLANQPLGLCGARRLPAGQHLHLHLAFPARRGDLQRAPGRGRGARQFRPLAAHRRSTAITTQQPEIGFLERRQAVTGQVTFKFTQNWSVLGVGALRSSRRSQINQHRVGLGYIDDCFAISLNYMTDYNYSGTTTTDNKVMLVINLRTIGGTSFSQGLNLRVTAPAGQPRICSERMQGPRGARRKSE